MRGSRTLPVRSSLISKFVFEDPVIGWSVIDIQGQRHQHAWTCATRNHPQITADPSASSNGLCTANRRLNS